MGRERLAEYSLVGPQARRAAEAGLAGADWFHPYDAMMQSAGTASEPTLDGTGSVVCGDDTFVLVLSLVGDRLVAACGVGHGNAVARPVAVAQHLIAAGAAVDAGALDRAGTDLAAVTKVLRSAHRAAGP
jgi:hypothetical protein